MKELPQKLQPARPAKVEPPPPDSGAEPSQLPADNQSREHDEAGGAAGANHDSERKPIPVRDLAESGAAPGTEDSDVTEVQLEMEDESWVVRVLGMAGSGSSGAVPLLLLGFWTVTDSSTSPDREALVVGKTLSSLSAESLTTAFKNAKTPSDPERKKPFFENLGQGKPR